MLRDHRVDCLIKLRASSMASGVLLPLAFILVAAGIFRENNVLLSHAAENSANAADAAEVCEFGLLPCDDEQCIPRKGWCDGPVDCVDGSDELYCRQRSPFDEEVNINNCEKSRHFRCETGECIPKAARCDDMPDCSGGEDEESCDYYFEYGMDPTTEETTSTHMPTTPTTTPITTVSSEKETPSSTSPPITTTTAVKPTEDRGDLRLPLLSIPSSSDSLKTGVRHILDERDEQWGWGRSTSKMTVALYLANHTYFDPDNYEGQLSAKQLEVRLAVDLMRHEDMPLRLPDLSHYVHALLATCHYPKDFYGVNLLKIMKKEMSHRRNRKLFVAPIAYLALCNAGDTTPDNQVIRRMKNMAYRRSQEQRWLDTQAYALLTISCYSQRNDSSGEWKFLKQDVAKNLTEWQLGDGSFGSVYSTALALQALIAAEEPGTESAKGRAMTYLKLKQKWDGSFGSEVGNFYALPALNLNSMAAIGRRQCKTLPSSTLSTEANSRGKKNKKKKKLHVHYSLWIGGGEKNEIHTITLTMPPHSNFLEVMEAAERANPKYKHDVWMGTRGPVVQSIAGRPVDVEKSLYWTLYRKVPLPFRPLIQNATATTARLRLLGASKYIKDIRKLHPKDGEHLAFWLKPYY